MPYDPIQDEDLGGQTLFGMCAKIEEVTANYTLSDVDNAKLLRVNSASTVTITVPKTLRDGFNVSVARWGAGDVVFSAASGALARSSETTITAQYGLVAMIVGKNATGNAAEFVLKGDIS